MLLQEPVDQLDRHARARGDALLARGLEDIGVAPLLRRHGGDDRALALDEPVVEIGGGELILDLGDARQHAHDPAHAPELLDLRQLLREIVEIEDALAHLLGHLGRLRRVDILRRLLDQADDVPHA